MAAVDPTLGFRKGIWHYPSQDDLIEIVPAEDFASDLENPRLHCLVLIAAPVWARTVAFAGMTTTKKGELPPEYKDYAHVGDADAAGILPEHHPIEHRIDLEPDTAPP